MTATTCFRASPLFSYSSSRSSSPFLLLLLFSPPMLAHSLTLQKTSSFPVSSSLQAQHTYTFTRTRYVRASELFWTRLVSSFGLPGERKAAVFFHGIYVRPSVQRACFFVCVSWRCCGLWRQTSFFLPPPLLLLSTELQRRRRRRRPYPAAFSSSSSLVVVLACV